ncbi:MAG: polysaccharide pyruvyl transferase family protein [Candidatus Peribacteraceae bacterium]
MRCLLIGNYGVGNLGDEALREYFQRRFPDVHWTVVTVDGTGMHEVPRLPLGLRSLFKPWWKTLAAMWQSDAVVFGGGSLFTDIESVFACVLWGWHALVARLCRKPVLLAFQGIGPFRTKTGEGIARWVISHASFLSVRDAASFARVKSWRKHTNVVQTSDPVILLLLEQNRVMQPKNVLTIIPRGKPAHSFISRAQELGTDTSFETVFILSLNPDAEDERAVCRSLEASIPGASIREIRSLDALISAIAGSSFVLSARYHGALAALALGVPYEAVPQGEGDKLASLRSISSPDALRISALEGEKVLREVLCNS